MNKIQTRKMNSCGNKGFFIYIVQEHRKYPEDMKTVM